MKFAHTMLVAAGLALTACGGGGGGSSDSGGESAAVLTANKVEITASNAADVIAEAIAGRDIGFGIYSASETSSISTLKNASAIEIVKFVRDLPKRASPNITINSAIVPLATETFSCSGGGTVTFNGSESDFTATFKNCVESGVKFNGTVRNIELGWSGYSESVKAIENLTLTTGSASIYSNSSFEYGESYYKYKVANANIYIKITEYGDTYEVALSNYNETYDEYTSPNTLKFGGAVGYKESGYHFAVGVTGDLQGIGDCYYDYPASGYETVTGSKGTIAKITYNKLVTPQVKVVLNGNEASPIFEGSCSAFDSWLGY